MVAVPNPRTWLANEDVTALKLRNLSNSVAFLKARPTFQGHQTLSQNVADQTYTPVQLDVDQVDNVSGHSPSTNPTRYVIKQPGWYLVSGFLFIAYTAASSTFTHSISVRATVNGVATDYRGETRPGATTHNPGVFGAELVLLDPATGDYVEILAWQNTGVSQTLGITVSPTNLKTSVMTAAWVAAASGTTGLAVPNPASFTSPLTAAQMNAYRDTTRFLIYPPIARLTRTGSVQSIPNGTWPTGTAITFDTATVDNYSGWSGGSPTRYTFPRSGLYYVYGMVSYSGNATGTRAAGLRVNAAAFTNWGGHDMPSSTGTAPAHRVAVARQLRVVAGDYVELMAFQSSGAARNTVAPNAVLIAVWRGV